jgi:hypothetical protein
MEKIILPKEVAEEVTRKAVYRSEGMAYLMWELTASDNKTAKWIDAELGNIVKLAQALVNGYEVEKTPEERAIEYIMDMDKVSTDAYYAIKEVLRILNIKLNHELLR